MRLSLDSQIARLVNEIGEFLYFSTNTIKTHVRGIMNKLSVDDRVQAAVIALRSGIV